MPDSSVSINHFSVCDCQDSRYPTFHLALRTLWVDVSSGQAIAVSYAIGDYGRAHHVLGHRDGDSTLSVSLQFGIEWDIHDLKHLLVELSEAHRAIWIDQLSIPQTSQNEIRTHLERIPQIYGTLEVIVLLPNAPCHCLQESLSAYEEGTMFLAKDGDFDLLEVINRCMSAIPLCSYYLRLWTKQEFTYAKTVSVRYASVSKTQCFRQLGSAWMLRYSRPCYSHSDYMSAFARHYYELASSEAAVFGKQADDVAWSQLKVLIDDIRSALSDAVHLYHMVGQTEEHDLYLSQHTHLYVAKFLLGQRLERQAYNGEGEFIHFGSYNSGHRATVENDYALAVFPSHKSYNIPPNREGMTLPELIDDGLSQLESHHFCRYKSFLPKGLFTFQPGSATCKPSLWLGSEPIHSARDIYGPLTSSTFSRVTNMGSIAIKIRGPNEFRAARMTRSSTYGTAFAGKSTNDVLAFMKTLGKIHWQYFGPRHHGTLESWAMAVLSRGIPAPQGKWPSRLHELAVFRECLHLSRGWEELPEIDHYDACFNLICDWAGIKMATAREMKLGLVVALGNLPCMGLFNGMVHKGLQTIENYQRAHGVPELRDRNINNAIIPEQWMSVMMDDYQGPLQAKKKKLVYEAFISDGAFDLTRIDEPPRETPIPMYQVVGVWYPTADNDPSIGAELAKSWSEEHLAVLM